MRITVVISMLFTALCTSCVRASQPCVIAPSHDTYAVEDPSTVWKRGVRQEVTEYVIDDKTGVRSFCIHGGYCYSAFVKINGQAVEALNIAGCRIQPGRQLDGETDYGLEGIPAKGAPATRRLPTLSDTESPKDIQGVAGACTENSYTNEGPADEDISGGRVRFSCNAAAVFFMDDQHKRIVIRFFDSDHLKDGPMLGFSGMMRDDGTTLSVTQMYYVNPNSNPIPVESDSICILDFAQAHLTGMHCVGHFNSGDRKYLGAVNFRAEAGQ